MFYKSFNGRDWVQSMFIISSFNLATLQQFIKKHQNRRYYHFKACGVLFNCIPYFMCNPPFSCKINNMPIIYYVLYSALSPVVAIPVITYTIKWNDRMRNFCQTVNKCIILFFRNGRRCRWTRHNVGQVSQSQGYQQRKKTPGGGEFPAQQIRRLLYYMARWCRIRGNSYITCTWCIIPNVNDDYFIPDSVKIGNMFILFIHFFKIYFRIELYFTKKDFIMIS